MSLETVLGNATDNLAALIAESKAAITHDPLPAVRGDAVQLTLVVQNLIFNAIKFRGSDTPQVHLSAQREADTWVISVADNGIGIPPELADQIFRLFVRLHPREQYSGTGTGLAICKRIIARHGGEIWVESELGQGSTFLFQLPAE